MAERRIISPRLVLTKPINTKPQWILYVPNLEPYSNCMLCNLSFSNPNFRKYFCPDLGDGIICNNCVLKKHKPANFKDDAGSDTASHIDYCVHVEVPSGGA